MIYFFVVLWILFRGGDVTGLEQISTKNSAGTEEVMTEIFFETLLTNKFEFKSSNESVAKTQNETLLQVMLGGKANETSHMENINYTLTEQFFNQMSSENTSHLKIDSSAPTLETSFVISFQEDFSTPVRTLPYKSSNLFLESSLDHVMSPVILENQRHPHLMNEDGEVYQWSVEEEAYDPTSVLETDAGEVYYSAYPEIEGITQSVYDYSDEVRELRSINEDHRNSTLAISMSSSSISSSAIISSKILVSSITPNITPTSHLASTEILTLETSESSTHKIDDIINGLVHLLGDNVKIANTTEAHHSFNSDVTSRSTRINNRGPPIFINSNEEMMSSPFSEHISTPDQLTSLTLPSSIPMVTSAFSSSTAIQSVKKTPSYSTISEYINPALQSTQSITTSKPSETTPTKEFAPTGPITAWKPVFQYGLDRFKTPTKLSSQTDIPNTGKHQISSASETSVIHVIPNLQSSVNPTAINKPVNTHSVLTTNNAVSLSNDEQLTLITADEAQNDGFVDIVLTATGVLNGLNPTKPIVLPTTTTTEQTVTKDDQSVYIDGRRQYFNLQQSDSWKGDVNNGQVPINSTINKPPGIRTTSSTAKIPTTIPSVNRPKQTTPTIRIDTCIVGDDSSCDTNNHEVCRTEGGVSSCSCPPSLSRDKSSNECIPVLSLLMYIRIDRFNNKRIFFDNSFLSETAQSELLKNEVVQAVNSLFKSSSLAPIYFGSNFNTFYAIGGKLAANLTILLHENVYTGTPLIKQVISRELLATIEQQNHTIGNSRLSVDTLLNPIPSINDLNECTDAELNDCSINAECENTFGTFKCNCLPGFTDKFPDEPVKRGRVCTACSADYCNNHGTCVLNGGVAECRCKGSYIGNKCEIDSEVLGVALGASLAALLIIILTFICLCMWSRRWKKEQHKPQLHSACPSFTYMDKPTKSQYDLHTLVSDNTLQWFPMRDTRSNFYLMESPECSQMSLAKPKSTLQQQCGMTARSSHLSHSQTQLLSSDDCLGEDHSRFYVPRPKARSRTEQQNIYSDLETMREDELTNSGFHQGHAVSNALYTHKLRSYYK